MYCIDSESCHIRHVAHTDMGYERARGVQEIKKNYQLPPLDAARGDEGFDKGEDYLQLDTARDGRAFSQGARALQEGSGSVAGGSREDALRASGSEV